MRTLDLFKDYMGSSQEMEKFVEFTRKRLQCEKDRTHGGAYTEHFVNYCAERAHEVVILQLLVEQQSAAILELKDKISNLEKFNTEAKVV